jgi:O-glycosyl hydrolase
MFVERSLRCAALAAAIVFAAHDSSVAQSFLTLRTAQQQNRAVAQSFCFATDGPTGPGWTRPDQIARVYFHEDLPAFFERTVTLQSTIPQETRLSWIFTGPHAGFTVEVSSDSVRLYQREYQSVGLRPAGVGEVVLHDDERRFIGEAKSITVRVDAHLSVAVLLNGETILQQPLVFDVTRHQLMFSGPRNQHLVLQGALLATQAQDAVVTVRPQELHQTMIGFGGSPSIPAYEELSAAGKERYWQMLHRYNLLIDREYPMGTQLKPDLSNIEDLRDATPHYYGDNFPNGEVSDFEYSRHIRALGGQVLYEMWALPTWATQAYTPQGTPIFDAWGKAVKTAARSEVYARIVVEFCRRAKERSGAAPEIVGIQNEVEQAPEIYAAMTHALRSALDEAGFRSTRIQMADAPYVAMALHRVADLKKDPKAWAQTDFVATHQYDDQRYLSDPDLFDAELDALHKAADGKQFLATEICLNDGRYQESSYRLAFQLGQFYQKDLTHLDAAMLLYCWTLLDVEQPNFGASRALLVPDRTHGGTPVASSFQLRVMGAFSRHVMAGMQRVTASSSDSDLLTVAFAGSTGLADKDARTLILLNRGTHAVRVRADWQGIQWKTMEQTSLYAENEELPATGDVVVQPGEIITLSTLAAPH